MSDEELTRTERFNEAVVATSSNESIEESFNQSFAYYLIDNL
jgi:hypothetical protein